jgi:hypothetical protein
MISKFLKKGSKRKLKNKIKIIVKLKEHVQRAGKAYALSLSLTSPPATQPIFSFSFPCRSKKKMKEGKSAAKLNNSNNQQQHQHQNGHFSPSKFAKLLDPEASWDKVLFLFALCL